MYVVVLANEEGEVLRGYGPYTFEDEAQQAQEALKLLFPVGEGTGLWTYHFKLETFNGYNYSDVMGLT